MLSSFRNWNRLRGGYHFTCANVSGSVPKISQWKPPVSHSHQLPQFSASASFHKTIMRNSSSNSRSNSKDGDEYPQLHEHLHHHHKRRKWVRYAGVAGLLLLASSGTIYYALTRRSESEPLPPIVKHFAKNHLARLRAMGISVEQQKQDYQEAKLHTEERDRIEFEEFLREIEQREGEQSSFMSRAWESIKIFSRMLYLLYKLVPLYLASYLMQKERWHEYVFDTFRTLGPCWIKLGQWMGTRPDLIDVNLCHVMQRFHGQGYIHSMKDTKRIIETSFGKTMEELFDEFVETPIGSGSIAQVYKARRRGESEYVAVKVRHPGVGSLLARDLRILRIICNVASKIPKYRWMNLDHNVVNFARNMNAQVDMRFEAENLRRFIENFKEIDNVIFPTPYEWNADVLIEEYMDMRSIAEFINHPNQKMRKTLAELGVFIFLKMLVKDNFLHSDLHNGNIFITFLPQKDNPEEMQPCFVLLDAGLVTQLSPQNRSTFLQLFAAFVIDDAETVAACLLDENFRNVYLHYRDQLEPRRIIQMEDFTASVRKLLYRLNHADAEGKRKVAPAAGELLQKAQKYQIPLQSNFTNLIMSAVIVEGVGRLLDPNLPFLAQCEDLLRHGSVEQARNYLKDKILGFRVFGDVAVDSESSD